MAVNKQDIAYLSDVEDVATTPSDAVPGNIPVFGADHALSDSGKKPRDFITQDGVDASVRTAAAEIWNAVNGAYAVAAYTASAWEAGTDYDAGDLCQYGGSGYRCIEPHSSGASFDAAKWELALTASGKIAIAAMLADRSNDGLAALADLAPAYNGDTTYSVGQMAVKGGVLQVCTRAGRGPAADFSHDATVEASIVSRFTALSDAIPGAVSNLTNDAGYTPSSAIDSAFNTASKGYSIGDTCSHGAGFYVCVRTVEQGAAWSKEDWAEKSFKSLISSSTQSQADWSESDSTAPSYIKNKPKIPSAIEIDEKLATKGAAADAKAVGEALAGAMTTDSVPFKVTELLPGTSEDPNAVVFQLLDRTMNVISHKIDAGKTILLIPPSQLKATDDNAVLARDFYVILNIESSTDVSVAFRRSSIQDAVGNAVSITAPVGKTVSFRLTDSDRDSSIFLISGYGDAAHNAIMQIEKALDEILKDGGSGIPTLGLYLPDEQGEYHEIRIVTDSETGEKNLGVEQEGVAK